MNTIYHTQTVAKACKLCGLPYVGHPNRDYCSLRCKRRAKNHRYSLTTQEPTKEKYYSHEYGTVSPSMAYSIFDYLRAADDNVPMVLVKEFSEPDKTIIPPEIGTHYNGRTIEIMKLPQELYEPKSRTVTEALAPELAMYNTVDGTFEEVPPKAKP